MSFFAYRKEKYDIDLDVPIYADDCTVNDMSVDFYCPNDECRCIVHLSAINSNKVSAHFKNVPSSPHVDGCWADGGTSHTFIKERDVKDFSVDSFLSEVIESSSPSSGSQSRKTNNTSTNDRKKSSNSNLIKTPRDLFWYCLDHPINVTVGDKQIKNVICCNRTDFLYSKYISDTKLIVCSYSSYDSNNSIIRFNYPANSSNQNRRFRIDVKIDDNIFDSVLKKFYNAQQPIVIFSTWSTVGTIVTGSVISNAQIFPLPK